MYETHISRYNTIDIFSADTGLVEIFHPEAKIGIVKQNYKPLHSSWIHRRCLS
jgi:hypothetical protein